MIVDLDAHQGNGYETDFKDNDSVYIMDVYNKWIYPKDAKAKQAIAKNVPLDYYTDDETYLRSVKKYVSPQITTLIDIKFKILEIFSRLLQSFVLIF